MTTVMHFGVVTIDNRRLPYVHSIEGDGPVLINTDFLQSFDDKFARWDNGDLLLAGYRLRWIEVRPGNVIAFELLNRNKPEIQ